MNRVAVVVGGSGGIGGPLVKRLCEVGWRVTVLSRGKRNTREGAQEGVTFHKADVSIFAQMKKAITEIARIHEHIDCLIYSAGRTPDVAVPLMKYEPEEFAKTFDVYVRGFLHAFQITLPHMTCGGHIVILGSAVTRFPSDHLPPIYAGHYAAAKAALAELAKWARREAHQKNVLLSLVAPGAVDTATHCIGALSQIPKNLLSIETLTAAILGMVLNGIEGDLQMVA